MAERPLEASLKVIGKGVDSTPVSMGSKPGMTNEFFWVSLN